MNKKQRKSFLYILCSIYVVVTIILFTYLISTMDEMKKTHYNQVEAYKAEKDSIKGRESFLQDFLVIDNNYILSQYEKAVEAYKEISSNKYKTSFEQDLIDLRLNKINEITTNIDTLSSNIEDYRFSLNKAKEEIELLKQKQDSLVQIKRSENEQLNQKIADLNEEMKEKNRALKHQEKVQVISFRNDKGNLIHYLGEISDGMANGGGIGIWDTGSLYKGNWKNNQRHGDGTYTWKDGHKYEGNFVEDVKEGKGTYYWSTGEKYVGKWKNNMRNGLGTLYDKDNNISYEGIWIDDNVKK